MGCLREYITEDELKEALNATDQHPHLMPIYYSIKHQLSKRFPACTIRVFGYPTQSPVLWLIHRYNKYVANFVYVWSKPTDAVTNEEFNEALSEFHGKCPIEENNIAVLPDYYVDMFAEHISSKLNLHPHLYPTYLYYMTPEQQTSVWELQLELPNGYTFGEVDLTRDSPIINKTWKHAREGDLQQTIEKLSRMPYGLIRKGNEAVAFEMCDPAGFQTHLFTLEEHRQKGLGTAVEMSISKKCIKEGICPNKCVELFNEAVLKASDRSKYWTRYEREGNVPIEVVFIHITSSPLRDYA